MRKLILQEFVTLDGCAAGPRGDVDFVPRATKGDQSFGRHQMELLATVDTILLGRVTYQLFSGYWPKVKEADEKAFADKMNATSKIVFSKTLDRAPWGEWKEATIVKERAADAVAKMKRQPGRDLIMWGSISVAQSLVEADLVDEYRLVMCPIVLGNGRALFGDKTGAREMAFSQTRAFDKGAVLVAYTDVRARSARERAGEKEHAHGIA